MIHVQPNRPALQFASNKGHLDDSGSPDILRTVREQSPATRWRSYIKSAPNIHEDFGPARVIPLGRAMLRWLKDRTKNPPIDEIRAVLRCRSRPTLFYGAIAVADLCRFGRGDVALKLFDQVSIAAAEQVLDCAPRESTPTTARNIVSLALRHRSAMVRLKAIWSAYWHCPEHFDALMKSVHPQQTPGERECMTECRSLLRDGYHAQFQSMSWSWRITYRDGQGMRSADVPKLVIDSIGFEEALKHIRRYDKKHAIVPWDEIVEGA